MGHRRVGNSGRIVALALAAGLALAACGDSGTVTTSAFSDVQSAASPTTAAPAATISPATTNPAADAPASEGERTADLGQGGVVPVAQTPAAIGRDVIFTAFLTVAVDDIGTAGAQATAVIESLGGFLFGQDTRAGDEARSVLTFKVRPEDFQTALTRLGAIGELRSQTVSADDVTERIVDLQSRISTGETSIERLRQLIEAAPGIEDIIKLERELIQRETTLEQERGQLRTLENLVSLATITLTLTEALANPAMSLDLSAYDGTGDEGTACPGRTGVGVPEGGDATLCFEITNTGDTPLTGFVLTDTVLELELADLNVVFGDPGDLLDAGQSIVLSTEVGVERDVRTRTRLTAIPVDQDGEPIEARTLVLTGSVFVDAVDPGGYPTFGEGLSAGWDLLKDGAQIASAILGWSLPFLWLPVVLFLFWRWLRGRAGFWRWLRRVREWNRPTPPEPAPLFPPPPPAPAAEPAPADEAGEDSPPWDGETDDEA